MSDLEMRTYVADEVDVVHRIEVEAGQFAMGGHIYPMPMVFLKLKKSNVGDIMKDGTDVEDHYQQVMLQAPIAAELVMDLMEALAACKPLLDPKSHEPPASER